VQDSRIKEAKLGQRRCYSVPEVAELLGLSPRKVNDLIASGKLGSIKIDKSRRVTDEHVDALLEQGTA
jgi:excisionase family DNA binding protein